MPELDQLLDTLVAEVNADTRAPGAPRAIKQAHRRRLKVTTVIATATVAFVAAAGGLAAGPFGGNDRGGAPLGEPVRPTPASPKVSPITADQFADRVRMTFAQETDWVIADNDPTMLARCAGDWSMDAGGGSGGSFGARTPGEAPTVWNDEIGFPSARQASDAAARLVQNLESCTAVEWQTERITQTGAVLASSAAGVTWIAQHGANVATLQVPTTEGPPPADVQVQVAVLLQSTIQ